MAPKKNAIPQRYRRANGTAINKEERAAVDAAEVWLLNSDSETDFVDLTSQPRRPSVSPLSAVATPVASPAFSSSPSPAPPTTPATPALRTRKDRGPELRDLCLRCHKDATKAAAEGSASFDPQCVVATAKSTRCGVCAGGKGRKRCERVCLTHP